MIIIFPNGAVGANLTNSQWVD